MVEKVVCVICDKPEHECKCDRYCTLCKGQFGVKMCKDGQYYCPDCREAIDISVVESHG